MNRNLKLVEQLMLIGRPGVSDVPSIEYKMRCIQAADHIVALEDAIEEIEATDPGIGGTGISWREIIQNALERWRALVENGGCHVIAGGQSVEVTEGEAAVVVGVLEELLRTEV
jgi:hypothetical protein